MKGQHNGTGFSVLGWAKWQLGHMLDNVTNLQLLAFAFFLLWGGIYWQVLMPLEGRLEEIHGLNESVQASFSLPGGESAIVPLSRSERLRAFLPSLDQREQQEGRLMALASLHGLQVERLDYSHESYAVAKIDRQYLRFKAIGSYGAQRRFMHAVLTALPNVAIDRITLSRGDPKHASMVASLELSLFYKVPEGKGK